ncbi:hypothetical protein U9M48_009264 [Paspalum notatum var. saurae]|uniref:Uncharacterized protein n=1 Tax=Paspalum notatum var. saurae TaxID=547442 RepID=A0AAQ3WEJ5_PASNO
MRSAFFLAHRDAAFPLPRAPPPRPQPTRASPPRAAPAVPRASRLPSWCASCSTRHPPLLLARFFCANRFPSARLRAVAAASSAPPGRRRASHPRIPAIAPRGWPVNQHHSLSVLVLCANRHLLLPAPAGSFAVRLLRPPRAKSVPWRPDLGNGCRPALPPPAPGRRTLPHRPPLCGARCASSPSQPTHILLAACPPAMVGGSASAPAPALALLQRIPVLAARKLRLILDRLSANRQLQRCATTYAEAQGEGGRECRPSRTGASLPGRGVGGRASPERPAEPRRGAVGRHRKFAVHRLLEAESRLWVAVFVRRPYDAAPCFAEVVERSASSTRPPRCCCAGVLAQAATLITYVYTKTDKCI